MTLIILDRDGVINVDSDEYIKSPDEWHPIPGSLEAIARLNKAGYIVTVATNQSGIGRGYYSVATLEAIHKKMQDALAAVGGHIDKIVYCPHSPDDHCDCRKPQPGMIKQLAKEYAENPSNILMIGDARRDLEAAHAAGARTILVLTGKGAKTFTDHPEFLKNIPVFKNLKEAVDDLLK